MKILIKKNDYSMRSRGLINYVIKPRSIELSVSVSLLSLVATTDADTNKILPNLLSLFIIHHEKTKMSFKIKITLESRVINT